jgi:hypothetical protein
VKRGILIAVVLVLGMCGAAGATTIAGDHLSLPYQRWVDESRMPTPNVSLEVHEDRQCADGYLACTDGIQVWFHPSGGGLGDRYWFMHEIGHAFDRWVLTDSDRSAFVSMLNAARPWDDDGAAHDTRPIERFADIYALCAVHSRFVSNGPYGRSIIRRTCSLIKTAWLRP